MYHDGRDGSGAVSRYVATELPPKRSHPQFDTRKKRKGSQCRRPGSSPESGLAGARVGDAGRAGARIGPRGCGRSTYLAYDARYGRLNCQPSAPLRQQPGRVIPAMAIHLNALFERLGMESSQRFEQPCSVGHKLTSAGGCRQSVRR